MEEGKAAPFLLEDPPYTTSVDATRAEGSAKARKILDRYSPDVQTGSIDELFVDFAGCESLCAEQPEIRLVADRAARSDS